jgi:hypothetical protein
LDFIISHLPWHGEVIGFHAFVSSLIVDVCLGQYFADIIIWSRKELRLTAFRSSRGCFLSDVGWGYNVEVVDKKERYVLEKTMDMHYKKMHFLMCIYSKTYLTE